MATNYKTLLDAFQGVIESAEEAAKASTDSPEVKVARQAKSLIANVKSLVPTPEGFDLETLTSALAPITSFAPDTFDRSDGALIATRLAKVLALDPEDRSEPFNKVADNATSLLDRWNATAPTRKARSSGGPSTTPASQLLATDGISVVTISMTYADSEGVEQSKTIAHGSTWSSLSNEVNKVAKVAFGIGDDVERWSYGKDADPSARVAWRDAVREMRAGSIEPHAFSIGGKVNVSMVATRA